MDTILIIAAAFALLLSFALCKSAGKKQNNMEKQTRQDIANPEQLYNLLISKL